MALRALHSVWAHRSTLGLLGNHIEVDTGKWTGTDAGIGAGVDSTFEYMVGGGSTSGCFCVRTMFGCL